MSNPGGQERSAAAGGGGDPPVELEQHIRTGNGADPVKLRQRFNALDVGKLFWNPAADGVSDPQLCVLRPNFDVDVNPFVHPPFYLDVESGAAPAAAAGSAPAADSDDEFPPPPPLPGPDVAINNVHQERQDDTGIPADDDDNDSTLGTSPTQPRRTYNAANFNDQRFEEGYDSDGHRGYHKPPAVAEEEDDDEIDNEKTVPMRVNGAAQAPRADPAVAAALEAAKALTVEDAKKLTVPKLKEQLQYRGVDIPPSARIAKLKELLVKAIKDGTPVLSPEAYAVPPISGFARGAAWRALEPMDATVEPPADAGNFRSPTEIDADVPPIKHNFAETFDVPAFTGTVRVPSQQARTPSPRRGRVHPGEGSRRSSPTSDASASTSTGGSRGSGLPTHTDVPITNGRPNPEFMLKHGLTHESHPADIFHAFLPIHSNESDVMSISKMMKWTNAKAQLMGAGAGGLQYPTFQPFSIDEVRQFLGLFMVHGLAPSPQLDQKMKSQSQNPINGNDLCHQVFGPNAALRLKQFKAFFALQDPLVDPPSRDDAPNHKIDPLFKHANKVSMAAWIPGRDLAGDEMTQGFQGHHRDKQRIKYKSEGDGFQCDAICDQGYCWIFHMRNQPAPKKYLEMGYAPLHARTLYLLEHLPFKYHRLWFDNLYNSAKFCKGAYTLKDKNGEPKPQLVGGVARTNRGIPDDVIQPEQKNKAAIERERGTVKAAVLEGDDDCPNLVAVSVYDVKPVHFISTHITSIEWVTKQRMGWSEARGEMVSFEFLRLSVNDAYNHGMDEVDVADHLRDHFRFDKWMRKTKWWWSLFLWCYEMLLVNSYLFYRGMCREAGVEPMSHYEYQYQVALAMLDPSSFGPSKSPSSRSGASNNGQSSVETRAASDAAASQQVTTRLTDSNLRRGGRMDIRRKRPGNGDHLPLPASSDSATCALHRYVAGVNKYRSHIMYCPTCHLHLCVHCYQPYHACDNVCECKEELKKKIPGQTRRRKRNLDER